MTFPEVIVLLRNLWVIIFAFLVIYHWATHSEKTSTTLTDANIKQEDIEPEIKKGVTLEDTEKPEHIVLEEAEKPIYFDPKPIRRLKPIFEYDHIKKSLDLEIIDVR